MSLYGQEESLRALQDLLTTGVTAPDSELSVGVGTALDDQVTVRFRNGAVDEVELGPRAKRASDADLSQAIRAATNAAIADCLAQRTASVQPPAFDQLLERLTSISEDAASSMQATTEGLDRALRAVERQAADQAARRPR